MEEDIEKMQDFIMVLRAEPEENPKAFLEIDYASQKELAQAIENLINKNKELLEKVNYLEEIRANQTYENEELEIMIEEMASFIEVAELDEDIAKTYCKNEACTEINKFNCQKCIIDYFRKKAKGE